MNCFQVDPKRLRLRKLRQPLSHSIVVNRAKLLRLDFSTLRGRLHILLQLHLIHFRIDVISELLGTSEDPVQHVEVHGTVNATARIQALGCDDTALARAVVVTHGGSDGPALGP